MAQLGFHFDVSPPPRASRTRGRRKSRVATIERDQLPLTLADRGNARPPISQKAKLEASLRARIDKYVMLELTKNISTMISTRRRGRVLYVRAHRMFAVAPEPVVDALAAFVSEDKIGARQAKLLDAYIEENRMLLAAQKSALPTQPFGEVHDLRSIFDELNAQYFDNKIEARLTWSIAPTKKKRRTMKMGSYSDDQRLIRMHPALDQEWVPRYFVAFVVFHEMLHQVHGAPEDECGRRQVHTPAFRRDERRFPDYKRAIAWEKKHLNRLMKY